MRAAQIIKYGGTEAVALNTNVQEPTPAVGEVKVEIYAAAINPFDAKLRAGFHEKNIPLPLPVTVGGDFSGIVKETGSDVSGFKKGDEVYGQASILAGGTGSLAEFAVVNPAFIGLKPKKVDHIHAAAFPLVGSSAIQALITHMNLSKDQKILIHGGAGGIGSLAIQIAKHLGAYVVTTVSSEDTEFVKKLGADQVIDYKTQTFEKEVKNFDAVFDTVGGDTNTRSYQVLKKGGILVSMLEQPKPDLEKQYGVTAIAQQTKITTASLAKLADLIDQGVLTVHIEKTFPLQLAGEALTFLEKSRTRGKVVILIK